MNTTGTGFHITLPSDSSQDLFPENTPSEYTNKLSQWIQLKGEWEVGLHSIAYTKWNIIQRLDEPIMYKENGVVEQGEKMKRYCTSIDEYVKNINKSLKTDLPNDEIVFALENGKVTIRLSSAYTVVLRKEQAIVLGFMKFDDSDEVKEIISTETGAYEANLHRRTNIHVYCDIIQPQIVGDKTVPLLGIVPTEKTSGTCETIYEVENIHYIPIQTKSFQEIKVLLRSSTNESIPFEYGRATITLHLRPIYF